MMSSGEAAAQYGAGPTLLGEGVFSIIFYYRLRKQSNTYRWGWIWQGVPRHDACCGQKNQAINECCLFNSPNFTHFRKLKYLIFCFYLNPFFVNFFMMVYDIFHLQNIEHWKILQKWSQIETCHMNLTSLVQQQIADSKQSQQKCSGHSTTHFLQSS